MNRYFIHSKNTLTTLFLGLLLASCMTLPENNTVREKNIFSISPEEITINEPFNIYLPKLRPSKISIKTPLNEWYIVHDIDENIFMLPINEFEKTNMIVITPSKLKGVIWKNGQKWVRRVFNTPGKYFIYLADNLETEPENTFSFEGMVTLHD